MGITPPWYSDPVEFLAFNAFVMRTSQLEQVAKEFAEQADRIDDEIDDEEALGHMLAAICEENGVGVDTLTKDEQSFLSNEINRRWS